MNKEYFARWKSNHKDRVKEYTKKYYHLHKQEIKERCKKWRLDNKEKIRIYHKQYKKLHPDANRESQRKYRERHPYDPSGKRYISSKPHPYRQYKKGECEKCGFIPIALCQLEVDHIDGNHKNNMETNLQTLCANCHRLKSFINGEFPFKRK